MTMVMSRAVNGNRYDASGKVIELVEFNVSTIDNVVYFHIAGDRLNKLYSMSIKSWNFLADHISKEKIEEN